jgi:hypothetical protein
MKSFLKLTFIGFLSPALLNLVMPSPVKADNQFDICLREIVNSGISVEQADTACADALIPKELSFCVEKISKETQIEALDALKNCYRVRRPVDMAYCVVDIDKKILGTYARKTSTPEETNAEKSDLEDMTTLESSKEESSMETKASPLMKALETCRSSLSPARHSECVIALSRTPAAESPLKAMETCINAEDFPRDLFPDL